MKKYILLITIILTALIAFNGCNNSSITADENTQEEKDVFSTENTESVDDESNKTLPDSGSHNFTVETEEGEITSPDGTVLAEYSYAYPVFEANEGDDEEYIAEINQMFKEYALVVVSRAEGEYENLLKEFEFYKGIGRMPDEYYRDFQIHTDENGIISITEIGYAYTGGAHGMHGNTSYTFDVVNGKELSLSDLLYGTEEEITEAFTQEFLKVSDEFYLGDSPSVVIPRELPAAEYYVDSEGVTAYFQEYQVGPYSSGFVSATISDKEMLKFDFSDLTK